MQKRQENLKTKLVTLFMLSLLATTAFVGYNSSTAYAATVQTVASTTYQTRTLAAGVNNNPWGYNFNPGNNIYDPPTDFDKYFNTINYFDKGKGYVVQCNDGMYSKSGGIRGSCSHHHGEGSPLYSH